MGFHPNGSNVLGQAIRLILIECLTNAHPWVWPATRVDGLVLHQIHISYGSIKTEKSKVRKFFFGSNPKSNKGLGLKKPDKSFNKALLKCLDPNCFKHGKFKLKARIIMRPLVIARERGPCVQILTEPKSKFSS